MINKIKEKLKSGKGESIAEVLVSLLISSLALVMLASMINSSSRIIQSSKANMEKYYSANNVLEARTAAADNSGTLSIKNGSKAVHLRYGEGTVSVNYYKNDKAPSGKQVVSFK
jgi:type II secretory pathway component PulJ